MWKQLCKALGTSGEAYNVVDEELDITLKELAGLLAGWSTRLIQVIFDFPY